jgi:DNA processing protein
MNENLQEITDHLAMSLIPGIGPRIARKIISASGSPTAFLEDPLHYKAPGVKPEHMNRRAIDEFRKKARKELSFIEKEGIVALIPTNPAYPHRLKACDDSPLVIFSSGNLNLNAGRMIAIVGTRNATEYGLRVTEELITEMARHRCSLVSGLAYGIDSMAHRAAQAAGIQNIGVLAHGLDRLYPGVNRSLADKMKENGGLLTDFFSGTKPDRENFPARNRIVAGLADAVIVVEAAISGGALITAGIASSYNRDVFAIPGRWGDPYSEGCNRIISHNKAAILTNASDLAWNMGWEDSGKTNPPVQINLFNELNQEEEILVNLLRQHKTIDIDSLAIQLNRPVSKVSATLLELEFKGIVRSFPGKQYQVTA